MNLYLTADGRYVGTQAEAKKAGKGWTPETVPTDKEGLIEYLNANRHLYELECPDPSAHRRLSDEEIRQSNSEEAQREAAIRMAPVNPSRDLKLQQGRELSQITDYIMGSEGYVLGSILNAGLERAAQINRKVG